MHTASENNCTTTNDAIKPTETHQITLDQISSLLSSKNKSTISEIKSILQSQIEGAITKLRNEIEQNAEGPKKIQSQLQEKITDLDNKIRHLQLQYETLQTEMLKLKSELRTENANPTIATTNPNTTKTFVLYGLMENYWEPEEETHESIIYAIQDILNINISGYIEDITRIGKRGFKRPIKIELISKRMVNYIIQNANFFKNTGLAVSEVLDEQALRERNFLRNALRSARQNGENAVIRNNKLVIDGKVRNIQDIYSQASSIENQNYKDGPTPNNSKNQEEIKRKEKEPKKRSQSTHNFRDLQYSLPEHSKYTAKNTSTGSTLRRNTTH